MTMRPSTLLVVCLFSLACLAEPPQMVDRFCGAGSDPTAGTNDVAIEVYGMCGVHDRWLLIRRGAEYAALKFTNVRAAKTDEWYGCAQFDAYYTYDPDGGLLGPGAKHITGRVSYFPAHPHQWTGGGRRLPQLGEIRLIFGSPACILDGQAGTAESQHLQFAGTNWESIQKVNVRDPRLKWFGYDEDRKRGTVLLKAVELPGD